MREPGDVNWDREVVYECMWSLLNQVEGHNRRAEGKRIESVLMTPLAAGVGKVSKERWAAQVVLALKHFVEAVGDAKGWSALQWDRIERIGDEIDNTWKGT